MQKDLAGRKLINGRYKLNKCVFASELGSLYLSGDKHHKNPDASTAPVLIHFFPNHSISYSELPKLFSTLQRNNSSLSCRFLPVVDYGCSDKTPYFVMAAPDSWSVNSLPILNGTPSSLHQQAINTTQDLLRNELISYGLVPQAFIVVPGGVYLLQTALLKQFQQLQQDDLLLPLHNIKDKHTTGKPARKRFAILGWASMIGIVIVGSAYAYYLSQQTGSNGIGKVPVEVLVQSPQEEETTLVPDKIERPNTPVVSQERQEVDSNVDTDVTADRADSQLSPRIMPDSLNSHQGPTNEETTTQQAIPEKPAKLNVADDKDTQRNQYEKNSSGTEAPGFRSQPQHKEAAITGDIKQEEPEAFPIEQNQEEVAVEAETVQSQQQEQQVTASPNIALAETKPVTPEPQPQQHPLISHDEATPQEPVKIDPAPIPPLPAELAVLQNLPVNTIMLTPVKARSDAPLPAEAEAQPEEIPQPTSDETVIPAPETEERNHPIMLADLDLSAAKESTNAAADKKPSSQEPTTGGMTKAQLIEKAYQAIKEDKLSEAADKGAVYYIRLLKRIDRTNPQVNRLARAVVSSYHVKARQAIQRKHQRAARQLLWVAGRMIKEFNLLQMNKAHQILKHRAEE